MEVVGLKSNKDLKFELSVCYEHSINGYFYIAFVWQIRSGSTFRVAFGSTFRVAFESTVGNAVRSCSRRRYGLHSGRQSNQNEMARSIEPK